MHASQLAGRQASKHARKLAGRQTGRPTSTQACWQTGKQASTRTSKHASKHAVEQARRQSSKHAIKQEHTQVKASKHASKRRPSTSHLEGEEVGETLQPLHAPIHVVSQKQKSPRGYIHPQLPHVVREEVQVLFGTRG